MAVMEILRRWVAELDGSSASLRGHNWGRANEKWANAIIALDQFEMGTITGDEALKQIKAYVLPWREPQSGAGQAQQVIRGNRGQ